MNKKDIKLLERKIDLLEYKILGLKKIHERNSEIAGALVSDVTDPNEKIQYGRINKKRSSFATRNLRTEERGDRA